MSGEFSKVPILDLLMGLEWILIYSGIDQQYSHFECPECRVDTKPTHEPGCALKATIDRISAKVAAREAKAQNQSQANLDAMGALEADADGIHAQYD